MERRYTILALVGLLVAAQTAAPVTGSASSPERVEIVLFPDFQCPFCAECADPFGQIQTQGLDGFDVTVRFRHFPLSIHPDARLAHQASLAAAEQGKFWEMHDVLFANRQRVQRADLLAHAKRLELNMKRFVSDLDSRRVKAVIEADVADGNRLRVSGTPTFFVNGKAFSGTRTLVELRQLIVRERWRARAIAEVTDDLMAIGRVGTPVTLELFADLLGSHNGESVSVRHEGAEHQWMQVPPGQLSIQPGSYPRGE